LTKKNIRKVRQKRKHENGSTGGEDPGTTGLGLSLVGLEGGGAKVFKKEGKRKKKDQVSTIKVRNRKKKSTRDVTHQNSRSWRSHILQTRPIKSTQLKKQQKAGPPQTQSLSEKKFPERSSETKATELHKKERKKNQKMCRT